MSGTVKQFVDFSNNTNNDTGENTAASIQPIADGEGVTGATLSRGGESLRQRTEAVRDAMADTLYLRDADRNLVTTGPGLVTWPGSTTSGASGIPVLSDTLWMIPMLTPGFAQVAPIPPVASAFGVLHLKRASDSLNSISVTSRRRSYAAGDRINVTVAAGGSFSCVLDSETGYSRTIKIVATGATTLSTVITALNGLTPASPDNTQLVTAALEGGALGSDLVLTTQAKQYISGNVDGEGHAITPTNLASFFASNPTQVLAEGDTLCIAFPMVTDTASTGGRRQAIPENSNTTVPSGSFFNSRVHPENLVNALPVCKVINGSLAFDTGAVVVAGATNVSISSINRGSAVVRNSGFDYGVTNSTARYGIADWENRVDLASNAVWRLGTSTPHGGGKRLELNVTASNVTARIDQSLEIPVEPNQSISMTAFLRQLIAPTGGTYEIWYSFGDRDSSLLSVLSTVISVLNTTDAGYRAASGTVQVSAGCYVLKSISILAVSTTFATTGVALLVDDVQLFVESSSAKVLPANDSRVRPVVVDALTVEDPATYLMGQLAALLRFTKSSPTNEGKLTVERKDQDYTGGKLPPALEVLGRILSIGSGVLDTAAHARLPRVGSQYAGGIDYTLVFETLASDGSGVGVRMYMNGTGLVMTMNASYDGTNWNKDITGIAATMTSFSNTQQMMSFHPASLDTAWALWATAYTFNGAEIVSSTSSNHPPLLALSNPNGARFTAFDHNGFLNTRHESYDIKWLSADSFTPTISVTGTGSYNLGMDSVSGFHGLFATVAANNDTVSFLTEDLVLSPIVANSLMILEWDHNPLGLTGNPVTFELGYKRDNSLPSTTDYIKFSKTSGNANWQFMTRAGTGASAFVQDTGVPTSNSIQRFRIEYYGANHPGGARAVGYINGALVAINTDTSKLPDTPGAALKIAGVFKATSAFSGNTVFGQICHRRRRFTGDDNV